VITYLVNCILDRKRASKKHIKVTQSYFKGLPENAAYLQSRIPEELKVDDLSELSLYVYTITSFSNVVIKDLKVRASCTCPSFLIAFHYWVEKDLVCKRMETITEPPQELVTNWKYINPEDILTLHLLVYSPLEEEFEDFFSFEVDGEGVEVTQGVASDTCEFFQDVT